MGLCIQHMIPHRGGLPHSDTPGSKLARSSSGIFAACHVLHRLLVPRHPPNALLLLNHNHTQEQPAGMRTTAKAITHTNTGNSRLSPILTQLSYTLKTPLNPAKPSRSAKPNPYRSLIRHGSDNHAMISRTPQLPPDKPVRRPATRRKPSCPARPGAHQNLIHSTKDQTQRHDHTKPRPTAVAQSQPNRPTRAGGHTKSLHRTPYPTTNPDHPASPGTPDMEADGIEPTTPCLQSRCSPS